MKKYSHHNRWSSANLLFHAYRRTLLPLIQQQPFPIGSPPVVIGAMGGSGTRVLVTILQLAGFWMGNWVNHKTGDAMATRYLLQKAFDRLFEEKNHPEPQLIQLFSQLIQAHRRGMLDSNGLWGWKNPRSMWIIPFLASLYPEMKFIHVVRDGRDMAISQNHNLLTKHGDFLLHTHHTQQNELELQIKLWCLGNRTAMQDGLNTLGNNYLLIKYESLCQRPDQSLNTLFNHLNIKPEPRVISKAKAMLETKNIGRWKAYNLPQLNQPDMDFRAALDEFGYE